MELLLSNNIILSNFWNFKKSPDGDFIKSVYFGCFLEFEA